MHDENGEIDCHAAMRHVDAFLDGELTEAEADEIRRHLDACEDCLDVADAEAAVKALVKRCCGGPPAPDGLRARLVMRYSHTEVTVRRQ